MAKELYAESTTPTRTYFDHFSKPKVSLSMQYISLVINCMFRDLVFYFIVTHPTFNL